MKLSRASRYVLQALVHLARKRPGVWVTAQEIGQAEGIPDKFLAKLLGEMVKAGVVRSVKGPGGGFSLARPAKHITMLEIIDAVDGPVRGEVSGVSAGGATALDRRLQAVSDGVAEMVREWLAEVTLAELARGK